MVASRMTRPRVTRRLFASRGVEPNLPHTAGRCPLPTDDRDVGDLSPPQTASARLGFGGAQRQAGNSLPSHRGSPKPSATPDVESRQTSWARDSICSSEYLPAISGWASSKCVFTLSRNSASVSPRSGAPQGHVVAFIVFPSGRLPDSSFCLGTSVRQHGNGIAERRGQRHTPL